MLLQHDAGASVSALSADLGWRSAEITAKLRSLRTDGHVEYRAGVWTAVGA